MDLSARELAFGDNTFVTVDSVNLEDVLCQIQTNAGNAHFGPLSSRDGL